MDAVRQPGPESGACGHLAARAMNRAVVLFLGGALVLTIVVGAGLLLVRPPDDEQPPHDSSDWIRRSSRYSPSLDESDLCRVSIATVPDPGRASLRLNMLVMNEALGSLIKPRVSPTPQRDRSKSHQGKRHSEAHKDRRPAGPTNHLAQPYPDSGQSSDCDVSRQPAWAERPGRVVNCPLGLGVRLDRLGAIEQASPTLPRNARP